MSWCDLSLISREQVSYLLIGSSSYVILIDAINKGYLTKMINDLCDVIHGISTDR